MDEKGSDERLMELFRDGKLLPVTKVKALQSVAPATRCRLALQGRFPSLRIGKRILTCDELVVEGLSKSIIRGRDEKGAQPMPNPERAAQIAASKARLRARGLPA